MTDQCGIVKNIKTEKSPEKLASLPKTALPRIYFIDREIASGKFPSTKALAKNYETSMSTISRDIAFMKDMLNAPIEYDALRRGYYYSQPNYRIPAGFTTAEDLLALGMAKSILSLYRNTPLYNAAQELLNSITAPLARDGKSDWFENRIVVPQVASAPIPPDVWNVIIAGLRENLVLDFEYRGTWDEDYKKRRVRPYQLLFDTGMWYLYGYAEERKGIRLFSLSRIKNITLTTDHFSLAKDYDYRISSGDSHFGVFAGQEKLRFCVAFYDEAAVWVRERQWAEDQKFKETEEAVVVDFTSTQYGKVLEWVLSHGCAARPLEPGKLVNDWRRHIREMKKMAGM
jgi:predicted DNA-binding transcriptional regulator YafY